MVLLRIIDGELKKGMRVKMMGTGGSYLSTASASSRPKKEMVASLGPGEIGFFTAAIKEVADTRVGDTVTDEKRPTAEPLPDFKEAQAVVFAGFFPVDAAKFEDLREAMGRLRLNDASFSYDMETSAAWALVSAADFSACCILKSPASASSANSIVDIITTAPVVIYKINMRDGTQKSLHNPVDMPDATLIESIEEPWIEATILVPDEYLGSILKLCEDRRGRQKQLTYAGSRAMVIYDLPLNEVVFDFYDRLKSVSRGYASFDYKMIGYEKGDLVRMGILVNGEPVDALAMVVHRARAEQRGRVMCEKLKELIPPPHVPDSDPGHHRRQDRGARNPVSHAQRRDGQMLRRRHQPQAQASGQAEGRQEEDAAVRQGRNSAGSLHRGAEDGLLRLGA